MSRADPAAIWAELMGKISRIRGGATPEQQYQISKNAQDIHVLYGVTESIQDLIPEGTSVSDPLVRASQVPGVLTKTIDTSSCASISEAIALLVAEIDLSKVTLNTTIRWDAVDGHTLRVCDINYDTAGYIVYSITAVASFYEPYGITHHILSIGSSGEYRIVKCLTSGTTETAYNVIPRSIIIQY